MHPGPHVDALDRMELVIDPFGLPGSKDLLALIAWYPVSNWIFTLMSHGCLPEFDWVIIVCNRWRVNDQQNYPGNFLFNKWDIRCISSKTYKITRVIFYLGTKTTRIEMTAFGHFKRHNVTSIFISTTTLTLTENPHKSPEQPPPHTYPTVVAATWLHNVIS